MPVISVEITKTIDERELQKRKRKQQKKKKSGQKGVRQKRARGTEALVKGRELKDFVVLLA